jgi:hypothetical protein
LASIRFAIIISSFSVIFFAFPFEALKVEINYVERAAREVEGIIRALLDFAQSFLLFVAN